MVGILKILYPLFLHLAVATPIVSNAVVALQTADGPSPIQKVVALLKDMKAQTEKEAEEDLTAYNKYMCWCETIKKEKSSAVEEAQTTIANLEAFVEEAAAKEGQLKTEIATLADDIASDKESLATATALREKEQSEFQAEEADLKETLDLLGQAIGVLAEATTLVQKGKGARVKAALLQVRKIVQRHPQFQGVMQKDLFDLMGSTQSFLPARTALQQDEDSDLPWIKTEEQKGIMANPNGLKGAAAGATSYSSRSTSILGILKEMGDRSAKNLASAQKADLEAMMSFESLKAAKTGEIEAGSKQKDQKSVELADLLDKVAKSKEDIEATKESLTADQQVLLEATKSCTSEEEEYAARSKVRNEEIKALGETLNILTGDEARDLFTKTISLLQVASMNVQDKASLATANTATTLAMQHIMAIARKHQNWALATLAVHVRLDAFTKVKEAMDKMTAELKAQQKEEAEKKDFCDKKIDETEDLIKVGENTKEDLAGKHKDEVSSIEVLKSEIATLSTQVSEAQVSLKSAGEERKAANMLYQTSMSDQRATIQILKMALDRLKEFYTPKSASLAQEEPVGAEPPKPSSTGYEKSGSAGGVLQLIGKIISDAEATEAELKLTEEQSQQEYAAFVDATGKSIEADRASIAEKEKQVAEASSEKSYTEEAQLANEAEVTKLGELLKATHLDCDFVTKYYDIRQKARAEEIDAIAEAKAILSGADFS